MLNYRRFQFCITDQNISYRSNVPAHALSRFSQRRNRTDAHGRETKLSDAKNTESLLGLRNPVKGSQRPHKDGMERELPTLSGTDPTTVR